MELRGELLKIGGKMPGNPTDSGKNAFVALAPRNALAIEMFEQGDNYSTACAECLPQFAGCRRALLV